MKIILAVLAFFVSIPLGRFILLATIRFVEAFVYWAQCVDVVCPKCNRKLTKLYFKCPDCNRVYENLYPNFQHVLYIRCACGRRLSTLRILSRSGCEAICPNDDCHHLLGEKGDELQIVAFPIVGAPASGKTTFVTSGVRALTSVIPRKRNWSAIFPFFEDKQYAARLKRLYETGVKPDKTNDRFPSAFCIDYRGDFFNEPKRLCLYDPAGESFKEAASLKKQRYYRFMAGIIVVIDPFALPGLRERFGARSQPENDDLNVTDEDQDECLDRLLNSLRDDHQTLSFKREENVPCALVLTKTDAFDLDRYVGEKGIEARRKRNPKIDRGEATDALCRYWLDQWGGGNIMNKLDRKFEKLRCFSVSAFGKKSKPGSPFQPERVEEPLEWLLQESGVDSRLGKRGILIFLFFVVVVPLSFLLLFFVREFAYSASP